MLLRFLSIVSLMLLSQWAMAEAANLAPIRATSTSDATKDAFAETLRVALEEAGFSVVGDSGGVITFEGSITKLDSAYVVALRKIMKEGKPYSQSLKIKDANDLDIASRRLVRAVVAGIPVNQDQAVGEITGQEVSEDVVRKKALQRIRIGFGPATAFGLGSADGIYHVSTAYHWEGAQYTPHVTADANWAPGSSQMKSLYSGIGLGYHLTRKDTAPYIGFDLGMTYVHRAKTDVTTADGSPLSRTGFTGTAKAGITILRAMETSLFGEFSIRPVPQGFNGKPAAIASFEFGILF